MPNATIHYKGYSCIMYSQHSPRHNYSSFVTSPATLTPGITCTCQDQSLTCLILAYPSPGCPSGTSSYKLWNPSLLQPYNRHRHNYFRYFLLLLLKLGLTCLRYGSWNHTVVVLYCPYGTYYLPCRSQVACCLHCSNFSPLFLSHFFFFFFVVIIAVLCSILLFRPSCQYEHKFTIFLCFSFTCLPKRTVACVSMNQMQFWCFCVYVWATAWTFCLFVFIDVFVI